MITHLATESLGPAPWSPWRTACGIEIRDDLEEPRLWDGIDDGPTCKKCRSSKALEELVRLTEEMGLYDNEYTK